MIGLLGGSEAKDRNGLVWWAVGRGGMVGLVLSFNGGSGVRGLCLVGLLGVSSDGTVMWWLLCC